MGDTQSNFADDEFQRAFGKAYSSSGSECSFCGNDIRDRRPIPLNGHDFDALLCSGECTESMRRYVVHKRQEMAARKRAAKTNGGGGGGVDARKEIDNKANAKGPTIIYI